MTAAAQQWYFRLECIHGVPTWPRFVKHVNLHFGPPMRNNPLGELIQLWRASSVEEYLEELLSVLCRCDEMTEKQHVQFFICGLCNPLHTDVELQNPVTLEAAMSLAWAYERILEFDEGDEAKLAAQRHDGRSDTLGHNIGTTNQSA